MPKATRKTLKLRLYIAGDAPNSIAAIANLRTICSQHFEARHEIEVVDLLKHPSRAAADGVIVTPTLLKLTPQPAQRLIGSLSDTQQVLTTLAGS